MEHTKKKLEKFKNETIDIQFHKNLLAEIEEELLLILAEREDIAFKIALESIKSNLPLQNKEETISHEAQQQKMIERYQLDKSLIKSRNTAII